MTSLLSVKDLSVSFDTSQGFRTAVEDFSIDLAEGEILSVVGESGSGKSVAMLALLGLLPSTAKVSMKSCSLAGHDWLSISEKKKRRVIGDELGMIFQEPFTSLNPCFTVGWQIGEKLQVHRGMKGVALKNAVIELLDQVGISDPAQRYSSFPHQLSGGMNQRVMIAMAIACKPRILIADEPTTALDVTIQGQILDLIKNLQKEYGMGLILITHDIGVVYEMADRVIVLYAGQKVEENTREAIFSSPSHPYTKALLESLPEHSEGGRLNSISGSIPNIHNRPSGCVFHPRCSFAQDVCKSAKPPIAEGSGYCRCYFPLSIEAQG